MAFERDPRTMTGAPETVTVPGGSDVEVFYAFNRWALSLFALLLTVMFVFSLAGLGDPRAPGWGNHAVFALCALFFGWLGFRSWRQALRPRPSLRLDPDGFECAQGRVPWTDVDDIHLVTRGSGDHTYEQLQFLLRSGATPLPPESPYFKGFSGVLTSLRTGFSSTLGHRTRASRVIEVSVGWRPRPALVAARRFFHPDDQEGADGTQWGFAAAERLAAPSEQQVPARTRRIRAVGGSADITFDGATVWITPTTPEARDEFGIDERVIDIEKVTELSFSRARIFRNGELVLVDDRGKTTVYFARKSNRVMRLMYSVLSIARQEPQPAGAEP